MVDDPRQIRTKTALTSALLRLLEDEALSSISIAALCQEAGVHRTTFYKHASSIEGFAVDMVTRELDAAATVSRPNADPLDAYQQAMVDVLRHVAEERALYRPLLASKWGAALRLAISERMQNRTRIALDVFAAQDGVTVPDYRDEIVAFVTGGLVGSIVLWALSDEIDADAWAAKIQGLMPVWWPLR